VSTTWSGFYFGGHAGVGFDQFSAGRDNLYKGTVHVYDAKLNAVGGVLGIQGGFNYQINNVVVGVEADLSGSPWMKKSDLGNSDADGRVNALASLRGRTGLALDKTLVYATGGIGMIRSAFSDSVTSTINKTSYVPVGGIGVEQKITSNMSVGIEGLMFGSPATANELKADGTSRASFSAGSTGTVRAKLNYSF